MSILSPWTEVFSPFYKLLLPLASYRHAAAFLLNIFNLFERPFFLLFDLRFVMFFKSIKAAKCRLVIDRDYLFTPSPF